MTKSENLRELELYIHIPFCVQKCKYCDFLSAPASGQVQSAYMDALLREIREGFGEETRDGFGEEACDGRNLVVSVFFGGGTPSVVEPVWIVRLMEAVRARYVLAEDAEVSMEVNPGTVTAESLRLYREAGVNRLSIGCQSARDEELARIGRIHTYGQFLEAYRQAREAGFSNINVDLISALPGQSMAGWEESLYRVLELLPPPEHISVYSLIVEEGTPFYEMQEKGLLELPDEDLEREMYWKTAEILQNYGYEHYEISNYAGKGFKCRHNCGYWQRRNYLGFGLGAASLYQNVRFRNTDSMERYLEMVPQCRLEEQCLEIREQMAETMFLGLRMAEGVSLSEFERLYGVSAEEIYGDAIRESMAQGLLERAKDNLILTKRGVDVSNYVMAKFL